VNGSTYAVSVAAVNADGLGGFSSSVNLTPITTPGSPNQLKVTVVKSKALLKWTAPPITGGSPITGYNVYIGAKSISPSAKPVNTSPIKATSTTIKIPKAKVLYSVEVRAINAAGVGSPSSAAVFEEP